MHYGAPSIQVVDDVVYMTLFRSVVEPDDPGERIMANHEETDELKGRRRLDDILSAMEVDRARWLFVEFDGKLVGQGSAGIYGDTHLAVGVSLMREARGMGLGKKTMLLLEDEARKLKRDILCLEVWSVNPVAHALYKDLGYEEIGRRRDFHRLDCGEYVDLIEMIKLLGGGEGCLAAAADKR